MKRRFTDSLVFPVQEGCVRAYRRVRPLGIWIGLWCLLLTGGVFAAEEPERFLAQLRARGYFDTASDYLAFIATTDLVDDAFKQSIPFEQAVTLKERAAHTSDRVEREQLLSEAIGAFQDFATANPDSLRAADVRLETANVYRLMARLTMAGAKRPGADRNVLEQKAAKYYSDAMAEAVKAEVSIQDQRKKVRSELAAVRKAAGNLKDPNRKVSKQERDLIALRDKLRDDWIKSEYTQVTTTNLQASVYERGSAEWKAAVEKAKSFDVDKVRKAVYGLKFDAPGGKKSMHPSNQHTLKPVYVGEIRKNGQFKIVWKSDGLVTPDSYSSYLHTDGKFPKPTGGPNGDGSL